MVGKSARRHREVAERIAREGHALGNHSWDHPSLPLLSSRGRRASSAGARRQLPPGSVPPRLFRPPWGHQSLGSRLDAARLGFRVVAWDVMAEDWRGDDAATLPERMVEKIRPGSIVVLHDALYATDAEEHRDREPVIEAVARLLERLAGRYRFVTVPELRPSAARATGTGTGRRTWTGSTARSEAAPRQVDRSPPTAAAPTSPPPAPARPPPPPGPPALDGSPVPPGSSSAACWRPPWRAPPPSTAGAGPAWWGTRRPT